MMLLDLHMIAVKVFASTDSSTLSNGHIRANIIAKLKAATVEVLTTAVSVALMMVRRAMVGHWDIALPLDVRPDW